VKTDGLDAAISTSASTSTGIKMFPFSCACAYACVCAATSEKEIPLRHNISTRIFTTRGYVWPLKTLDPDYPAPIEFGSFG